MNGDAAFGQALSHIKGGRNRSSGGNSNRTQLPADDNLLWDYAKKHGLSDARPGEDFFQYRNRLKAEIRRKKES